MDIQQKSAVAINKKSFLTAVIILFLLMMIAYVLTMIVPAGTFERTFNGAGQQVVIEGSFTYIEADGIGFFQFLFSPVLVLASADNVTLIAIILFLLMIGASFNALDHSGALKYMLMKIVDRFRHKRMMVLYAVSFFFMFMGAAVGSFEEVVPLVPIVIALSYSLGWDVMTGLGMSILAVCCGFSSGVINPFTVGVAQQLAELPIFSGMLYRLIGFIIIYLFLILFLRSHVRKLEAQSQIVEIPEQYRLSDDEFVKDKKMEHALIGFMIVMGITIAVILSSSFIDGLGGYLMPIVALMFLIAGIVTSKLSGMKTTVMLRHFRQGAVSICPAVLLILMAGSVKYIITEGMILDTILHAGIGLIQQTSPIISILVIYALVLVIEIFIASGSAKAVLLIPIIVPLVDIAMISRQTAILAYAYGDGFSNILYPTNAVLLIVLGLAGISYGKWLKFIVKFELGIFAITAALLIFAHLFAYVVS